MGCDIHWWSETRRQGAWACDQAASRQVEVEDRGTPHEYTNTHLDSFPNRERDYWLFGLLAGVRVLRPWSFEAKGMPDDASKEVHEQYTQWDCDGHTHSWLNRAELKAKLEELGPERVKQLIAPEYVYSSEHVAHSIARLTEIIGGLNANVPDEDQRIVFWFDN